MPRRHQRARFGKQEEQQAIDDRERLLKRVAGIVGLRSTAMAAIESAGKCRERFEYATAERGLEPSNPCFSERSSTASSWLEPSARARRDS